MPLPIDTKETLNSIKFLTGTGSVYRGVPLGDLLNTAYDIDPISVIGGAADPSAGAGFAGNPGDLYRRDAAGVNGGELWVKTGDANTAWSLVNTVGSNDNLGNHIATEALKMATFNINNIGELQGKATSSPTGHNVVVSTQSGAAWVDGGKVFTIINGPAEMMNLRQSTNFFGGAAMNIFSLYDTSGGEVMQILPDNSGVPQIVLGEDKPFLIYNTDDVTLSAGRKETWLTMESSNPSAGPFFGQPGPAIKLYVNGLGEASAGFNCFRGGGGTDYVAQVWTGEGSGAIAQGMLVHSLPFSALGLSDVFVQFAPASVGVRFAMGVAGDFSVHRNLYLANTKVLGAQGAAVSDATDAASAITQINLVLARMRAHGLIAT